MTRSLALFSVLIVDDDPVFCNMLQLTLEHNGMDDITIVGDGHAVRKLISQGRKIDVITLDLNMPDCDGIEVVTMLGKAGFEGLVILISGADEAVIAAASAYAGATLKTEPVVFRKPVNWDRIVDCILEFAGRDTGQAS